MSVISTVHPDPAATEAETTPRRRTRRGLRRLALGLLTGTIAASLVFGAGAPANAYSQNSAGNGATQPNGPAVVVGSNAIYQPGIWMMRNGAVAASQAQFVSAQYLLQVWTTAGWRTADSFYQGSYISSYATSVQMPSITLQPTTAFAYSRVTTGIWRVTYTFTWGGPWSTQGAVGGTTGWAVLYPTKRSEIQCGIARCSMADGYVQTW